MLMSHQTYLRLLLPRTPSRTSLSAKPAPAFSGAGFFNVVFYLRAPLRYLIIISSINVNESNTIEEVFARKIRPTRISHSFHTPRDSRRGGSWYWRHTPKCNPRGEHELFR